MSRTHVDGVEPVRTDPDDNLTTRLWQRAELSGSREILSSWVDGAWRGVTWAELASRVRGAAAGLVAAGVGRGDRVALMAPTRLEWTVADLAVLAAGAVTVPVYETSSVAQCEWILADSGATIAIAGSADHAKRLDAARSAAPDLREIVVLDDAGLEGLAERATDEERAEVDARVAAVGGEDVASLIYTSGTTGNPKGCVLTHGNLLGTARQTERILPELFNTQESTLLFLPLAHVFGRLIQIAALESDLRMGYARSVETLVEDLQSFRPTFLLSVPRVFEKVFNTAQRKAEGPKRKVFDFAVATSRELAASPSPGLATRLKHTIADRLVYAKLRDALGGRVKYCVSGGAPLAEHLGMFFDAAGITVLEAYGLTETSAGTCLNQVGRRRLGTVGTPNAGTAVRIDDDGELLIKGQGVFTGYHRNDAATREVFTDDGWFRSGDLGAIDDDGFVRIVGRKKEIIVTAGGKNVAPAVLEERLKANRLVSQAMVVGDAKPFIAAIVTLEPDELAAFATEQGLSGTPAELSRDAGVRAEVQRAVDHANEAVSKAEAVKRFRILERDFDLAHDEITPSLKVRRPVIAEHFADEIAGLYRSESGAPR